jgi:putative nucleotidyltransferase with HDIG domain
MQNIDLYQLVSSLALSIDLAESSIMRENEVLDPSSDINYSKHKFLNHSKRTSYVSVNLAKIISKDVSFIQKVFISSGLHDIGTCSNFDECHMSSNFILQHSLKGCSLLKKLPLDSDIADIIKYHHENFNGAGYFNLKGDDIPLISQIIHLADTFELLYDETKPNYIQRNTIKDWIKSKTGTLFSPYIVDAFMDVQSKEYFWWDVENLGFMPAILEDIRPDGSAPVSLQHLKGIAEVFADIIDTKSPSTFKHSTNLSKILGLTSDYLSFNEEKRMSLEIAALLHDIGKLAIPNSILNKSQSLNSIEFTIIKSHPYYTRAVLSEIDGFQEITNWASNHHEKLNGSGYPMGLKEAHLTLEEKLMTVCDIYEALSSDRPYKKGMEKGKVFKILDSLVYKQHICARAVSILKEII